MLMILFSTLWSLNKYETPTHRNFVFSETWMRLEVLQAFKLFFLILDVTERKLSLNIDAL